MYKRLSEAFYQLVAYRWILPKRLNRYAENRMVIYRNDVFLKDLKSRIN